MDSYQLILELSYNYSLTIWLKNENKNTLALIIATNLESVQISKVIVVLNEVFSKSYKHFM